MQNYQPILSPPARRVVFIILPLMYLAGLIGLNLPATASLFEVLTPFNPVSYTHLITYRSYSQHQCGNDTLLLRKPNSGVLDHRGYPELRRPTR